MQIKSISISLPPNTILCNGQYKVLSVLGEGGFGITYKAYDIKKNVFCAIKEYLPTDFSLRDEDNITVVVKSERDIAYYTSGLKNFIKEAETIAMFKHLNIVRILDFFEENSTAYFVMPYEEGIDLEKKIQQRETFFTEKEILRIIVPILNALKVLHKEGILHRDIKPANILLREKGMPILIDFGAAREHIRESMKLSRILTPGYAPLEQYSTEAKNQGPWTDIYALGITLYRMITNINDKDIPNPQDRLSAKDKGLKDPLRVEDYRDKYSEKLIYAVKKMTQIQSIDRPKNVDEVFELLLKENSSNEPNTLKKSIPINKTTIIDEDEKLVKKNNQIDNTKSKENISQEITEDNLGKTEIKKPIYASLALRVLAQIIDTIIVFILLFIILKVFYISSVVSIIIIFTIGMSMYYIIFESSPKKGTLGKQLVNIQVTDLKGQKIGFLRAFIRYLIFYILGGIGIFFALFNKKKQTLHDIAADTIVIKKELK